MLDHDPPFTQQLAALVTPEVPSILACARHLCRRQSVKTFNKLGIFAHIALDL
jgi:hypothetical protein